MRDNALSRKPAPSVNADFEMKVPSAFENGNSVFCCK